MNNAAVSFNAVGENSIKEPETIIKTNYYGAKLLTDALLPLFRRSVSVGRILNISSRLGALNVIHSFFLLLYFFFEFIFYQREVLAIFSLVRKILNVRYI